MKSLVALWCVLLVVNELELAVNAVRRTRYRSRNRVRCEPYKGTFCSKYLKGKNVYVKDRQQNVENKVATLIGILNRHVTDRCKEYVIPTLCNYIIPPCAKDSKKPRPIRFCRDDCEVLQNTVCKLEFHYAKQRFAKMLPDCSVLPGPGSPEYKTCIRVTMKAVSFTAKVENITMIAGMQVTLKCRLSRKKIPFNITWLKNGQPMTSKYKIRRFKWGSRLRIKRARQEDAGNYTCVVRANGQEVRAAGWLSILGTSSRPTMKKVYTAKPPTSTTKPTKKVKEKFPRCEPYRGKVCAEFMYGSPVYATSRHHQRIIEGKLSGIISTLRRAKHVSSKCRKYWIRAICFEAFLACDVKTRTRKHRLCKKDCLSLFDDVCAVELQVAKGSPAMRDLSLLPNCSVIPDEGTTDHGFCSPLKKLGKSQTIPTLPTTFPTCEVYRGNICSEFLAGETIYADNKYFQGNIESKLSQPLKAIRAISSMSPRCRQYGIRALCYHFFLACDPKTVEPKFRLCRKDCFALYDDVCSVELSLAKNDPYIKGLLPNCSKLSQDEDKDQKFCSPLGIPGKGQLVPTSPETYPACEAYQGDTCSEFLAGKSIFAEQKDSQKNMEDKLSRPLTQIRALATMSPRCRQYGIRALCYHFFLTCDPKTAEPKYRLCRKDCFALYNDVCAVELSLAKSDPYIKGLLPNCSELSEEGTKDERFCSPLGIADYSGTSVISYDYPKKMSVEYLNRSKDQYCYNGTGEDYIGRLNVTKYGMPCLSWKSNDPVYKLSHNFCRNPRGQHEAPWCYVDKNTYEYCVIPKCSEATSQRALRESPSLMPVGRTIYVISAIMAVLILAFVSIIVYLKVQHRRSTLPNRDHSSSGSISKSTQSTLQQPSSDFKQSLVDVKSCVFTEIDDANQGKVKFLELLGEGGFAKVCKAALMRNETEYTDVRLAIKRLKPNVPPQVVENFKNEISVLMGLQDINVLCLVGVSAGEEPLFMVFEYFEDMDMHRYLNLHIPSPAQLQDDLRDDCMHDPDEVLFLDFALQVASGMAYLAENNFIHRDLAARNCFITEDNIVKISNLGIGSCRYPADYSWVHGSSLLPVRWMPPEALNSLHFTHRSDVWSFGVVLWEIYSYGRQPYSGYNNQEAIECIRNMQMLPCPDGCPARMYALMKGCFEESSWDRPQFSDICSQLRGWAGDSIGENH
ncbi:tyrosine-protein kinase transmembrane receptor ROR2 [Nematostella vectensis]|uniref:tyrosine-protein kinase transmembrane receptor ROR2 n=1 Tax=Nematostella vectensis TaxID=45351 RepID=UPI00207724E7|nr:tyrosine-protein kinase transmembrane receptor ROR2 [Nematostella vectensis]XP_032241529.2 tyrosine-protein kinase transmembrane receptor ROR2 [Nematostella vectensis]XP_048586777.1 tyrosine-protein kinase transmembrane receptor ROR2 [Nematostella vectensis]